MAEMPDAVGALMESRLTTQAEAKPKATVLVAQPLTRAQQFAGVYEEHSRAIYYLALRMLGNPALAEDVTHDVFLKAFRKIGAFRGNAGIRTWLYRIAINQCTNFIRSWPQRKVFHQAYDETLENIPAGADSPLRVLEIKELGERIQNALNALPEEYRLLLLLAADGTLSYEEIGTLGNQTGDAVRGKLYRARKAFVAIFQKSS